VIEDVSSLPRLAMSIVTFKQTAIDNLHGASSRDVAFLVPFFAGVSEMAGQSATLVLNRVPKLRLAASLVMTGLVYVLTALAWSFLSGMVASIFSPHHVSISLMSAIICISFAPRILGILTIAPYYGEFLGRLLDAWMIAVAAFAIHLAFDLPPAAAALVGVSGWAIWILLRDGADSLLAPMLRRLEETIAGRPLPVTYATVDDLIRERVAQGRNGRADD
jgi:hypothetical protein